MARQQTREMIAVNIMRRIHTLLFPTYHDVNQLLRIWPGKSRKQVTALRAMIGELRNTPQNTVGWTDPDARIPERLSGKLSVTRAERVLGVAV